MPRPAEVTDAEIIAAGRAIAAAGKPVSAYSLRLELGRGSPPRLRDVWTAHEAAAAKAAAGQARSAQEPPALPASVRDELSVLTRSLNDGIEGVVRRIAADLSAQAAAGTQTERDLLARERNRITAAEGEALDAYSALADEVDRLRAEQDVLQDQLHHARVARDAADLLRRHESDRCAAADAGRVEALAEAARADERAAIAERWIAELEGDLAALRRTEVEAAAELASLRAHQREIEIDRQGVPEGIGIEPVITRPLPGGRPVRGRRAAARAPLSRPAELADSTLGGPSGLEGIPSAADAAGAAP